MWYWHFPLEHFARCDVQIPSGLTLEYTSYLWHSVRTRLVELLIMWTGHCTDHQWPTGLEPAGTCHPSSFLLAGFPYPLLPHPLPQRHHHRCLLPQCPIIDKMRMKTVVVSSITPANALKVKANWKEAIGISELFLSFCIEIQIFEMEN